MIHIVDLICLNFDRVDLDPPALHSHQPDST